MRTAGVADLKARLTRYLKIVKRGGEITVTDRGRPVARLVPIREPMDADDRLDELVAAGLARPGVGRVPARFWKEPPKVKDPQGTVLKSLLEERESLP